MFLQNQKNIILKTTYSNKFLEIVELRIVLYSFIQYLL